MRNYLFKKFDDNGNGSLNLNEVIAGFKGIDEKLSYIYKAKGLVQTAFKAAKRKFPLSKDIGDKYIQQPELRLLFYYLHQYFKYF